MTQKMSWMDEMKACDRGFCEAGRPHKHCSECRGWMTRWTETDICLTCAREAGEG